METKKKKQATRDSRGMMRTGTLKLVTRHGRGPWYDKKNTELLKEAKKKYKPAHYLEALSLQRSIERACRAWSSDKGKEIKFSWYTYPRASH